MVKTDLVPYGDTDALANAVLHYLDDREFACSVGAAARQRSLDFSTQRFIGNFIEVFIRRCHVGSIPPNPLWGTYSHPANRYIITLLSHLPLQTLSTLTIHLLKARNA